MPRFPRLSLGLLLAALILAPVSLVRGQDEPRAIVPPELSDEARREYAAGLKDVRSAIAGKDYTVATARLETLLRSRPREAQARFLLGTVQSAQGNADAAIATYRALTEDYPELPEPYNNLAVLLADRGDYSGARLALETAVAAAPDWPVARENLGDLYARLAAAEYERAVALDRNNKSASTKLTLARQLLPGK